jgi:ABC-type multidrug transport system ATPase subunit
LTHDGQRYFIEDLGSSNGTFIDGQRLTTRVELRPGNLIGLGQSVTLRFVVPLAETRVSAYAEDAPDATRLEYAGTMMEDMPATEQSAAAVEDYPRLVVSIGGQPGQTYSLTAAEYTIGRADSNDIVIPSPIVSRFHARLVQAGRGYRLEPALKASNPLQFAGQPLTQERVAEDGDQFVIGRPGTENAVYLTYESPVSAARPGVISPVPEGDATQLLEDVDEESFRAPAAGVVAAAAASPADPGQTLLQDDFVQAAPDMPVRFEVQIAGNPAQTYTITGERITIGRAEDNDIIIPSRIVSRHHGYLEKMPYGGYQFVPLAEAANPVQFEGRPLMEPHLLRHQDLLRIGGLDPGSMVSMIYRSPAEAREAVEARTLEFGDRDVMTIGRDASNDLVLDNPTVSRFHAQIERVGQRYRVRDLRSSNGTFVNGQPIEGEVWLKPGDAVRIGRVRFDMGEDRLAAIDETGGMKVEAVGLNKWVRKDLNILKNISLVFQPREFVVVVGQSGGGKTTLVDAIAGYRPATHGSVEVNDLDVYRNFDAIRNDIGYVPQKDIIHMELSVFEALDYSAQLRMPPDTTKEERHQRIYEVMEDLDIAHRKDIPIHRLSGGQQKRVSIGVELLTKPGLFFLDEPTSGLDPGTETALMQLMRRLADQGRTIALITHATKNVMLADKVVFLARGGYLAWFGPPDEALAYFDQFRSERDRRTREMEFDEIYAILEDQGKGTAEEWAERYMQHPTYQQYVAQPLEHRDLVQQPENPDISPQPKRKRQVSSARQFRILSARNIRILTRDRFALLLMLVAAPIVSLLDVILSLALGNNIFDRQFGAIQNVVITLFLLTVYGVMVGGLAQMREIVKEQDIYKRERLVNLRLFPYILSKIWVAALLALYQSLVYVLVHYLVFQMPGGWLEFGLIYITMSLATMAGMMLGLFASAIAPNPNSAPLIVVLLVLPQIVMAGALVPLPEPLTALTATRWAFQSFMAITGAGSDVAADACWVLNEDEQSELTTAQKEESCICLGPNVLTQCNFPGVAETFTEEFNATPPDPPTTEPPPDEVPPTPGPPPVEPPQPEFPPRPTPCADEADLVCLQDFREASEAWEELITPTQTAYEVELDIFRAELAVFQEDVEEYPNLLEDLQEEQVAFQREQAEYQQAVAIYNAERAQAIVPAEETIRRFFDSLGWTFTNKDDPNEFWGVVGGAWGALLVMNGVLFLGTVLFQKRKDSSR